MATFPTLRSLTMRLETFPDRTSCCPLSEKARAREAHTFADFSSRGNRVAKSDLSSEKNKSGMSRLRESDPVSAVGRRHENGNILGDVNAKA